MVYKWIRNISIYANIWVMTIGSRLHSECGLEGCENVELITLKPRVSFKWCDRFDRLVHPGYAEFFYRAYKLTGKIAKQHDIDVCHHLSPFSLRYPSPLISTNVPLVVGPIYGGLRAPASMRKLAVKEGWLSKLRAVDNFRMRFDPLLRRHYSQATKLVISAPYVQQSFLPKHRHKSTIISGIAVDGKDFDKHIQRNPCDVLRIISVARIVASKGLELMILALAKLADRNVRLTIYGRGPLETEYRELVAKLRIADRIIWKGFSPHEMILKAYGDADVFVLPSLKEPAGIAVIEAMAAGLPIVCVDAGGPAFTVTKKCGIKVPLAKKEQMVNDLAKGIAKLRDNPQLRMVMGKNAQERVRRKFTWDAVVDRMLKVYHEVLPMA